MSERLEDLWTWLRRKACRHKDGSAYDEVRLVDGATVSWTAMWCCVDCGDVLGVEASFYGDKERLARAIAEEMARPTPPAMTHQRSPSEARGEE